MAKYKLSSFIKLRESFDRLELFVKNYINDRKLNKIAIGDQNWTNLVDVISSKFSGDIGDPQEFFGGELLDMLYDMGVKVDHGDDDNEPYNPIAQANAEYESPSDRRYNSDSWVQAQRDMNEAPIKTDIGTVDTDFYPQKLSQVDPSSAKAAVRAGKKDKDENDDAAIASKIKTGFASPVSKLFPAQTEVIPEKATGIALLMLDKGKVGGDLGAIISGDNHIMDGHHRWAGTTLVDPNASVEGIKVDIPGDALVGILNVYTKGALGRNQGNPGKGNVNAFTPEKIKSVLDDFLQNGFETFDFLDGMSNKKYTPEEVKTILGKMKGANGDAEKGKELMAANAAKLNKKIPDWAPPRVDMPVINSDELDGLISRLKSGEFDIVEPYSLQVKIGKKQGKEEEEPVAEGLDFIHMMKVRAGIVK